MVYFKLPLVLMNRSLRIVLCPEHFLRSALRSFSASTGNLPKFTICTSEDPDSMRISFRYGSFPQNLSVVVEKKEKLHTVFSKIIQIIAALSKKEELRRSIVSKYSACTVSENAFDGDKSEKMDICLIHNDQPLECSLPSSEALTHGTLLKIGQYMYEVDQDSPTVEKLILPKTILAGCIIRPRVITKHADVLHSKFLWYHSATEEEVEAFGSSESEDILKVKEQWWIKVSEGLLYETSKNDIGRRLRVTCVPKLDERSGRMSAAESAGVVFKGPENFPFEERHLYTKKFTMADSIRCLSYNVLANVYVETKKFPYCSSVARDIYYRKQLLLKELLGYNSDVLCLQEVQERIFVYDLLPVLQEAGYDGCYVKKGGRRCEGVACFFRTSKFNVIKKEGVLLNTVIKRKDIFIELLTKVSGNRKDLSKLLAQDSALQLVLLEHKDNPKRRILVSNTHLYSNKDMPEVRLLQSALCVCYIEHMLKMQDDEIAHTAVLFCGDFNSLPQSSVLQFLLQGSFECCSSWNKSGSGSTDTTLRHCLSLDSACGFPAYTNYTQEFNGCLDYIFYDKKFFSVSEIVPFPSHEAVTRNIGLPSELFPSDHIPIICTLKWK